MKTQSTQNNIDIIGDIHGEFAMLVRLLSTLGYRPAHKTGETPLEAVTWAHPTRTAVFIGDLIDRGPDSPRVLAFVRRMAEAGTARVLMGNHEFNAVSHATPDGAGGWLRPHTAAKIGPHQTTRDQFAHAPDAWADHLAWFRTLPTSLDRGGLRVVHAAWHEASIARLNRVDPWTHEALTESYRDPAARAARELVLNGPEVELPAGAYFQDHGGMRRTAIRTAWWAAPSRERWTDILFPKVYTIRGLDDAAVTAPPPAFYGCDEPPVVFGHYALAPDAGAVQAPNVACIDFGCGKGGALGAYRWDGETTLDERKVVRVFAPAIHRTP